MPVVFIICASAVAENRETATSSARYFRLDMSGPSVPQAKTLFHPHSTRGYVAGSTEIRPHPVITTCLVSQRLQMLG